MDDVRQTWMIDPRFDAAVEALLKDPWPDEADPGYCEVREVGTWERRPSRPERLLVDIHEAARILGCGRSLLYEFIRAGQLPVVKLGHLTRIPFSVLEEFVARRLAERRCDTRAGWKEFDR